MQRNWSLLFIVVTVLASVNNMGAQSATATPNLAAPASQQPSQSTNQQAPATSSTEPLHPANPNQESKEKKKEEETGTSNDRLFYALPNFLTVDTNNVPPLTVKQKFAVVTRGSFDYIQLPWYAFLAGISQAEDSEPGYGQGAEGYAKRLGAYFADGTIENYMTGAVLPSLLHQDPRFYEEANGGFMHRTEYAVSRIFVTRTDSRKEQFNYSEVAGSAMSAFISTYSYHPEGDRTVSNTLSVWGTQVGYDTITIVVKEFWPDIRRMMNKKHASKAATGEAKTP